MSEKYRSASDWLTRAALVSTILVAMVLAVHPVFVDDFWMMLASGRWIWEHGQIPRSDPFSWTMTAQQPWIDFEWLFQVLVYGVYQIVGLNGLIVCFAVVAAVMMGLCTVWCRRLLPTRVIPLTLVVMVLLASDRLLCFRPDYFSLTFTVAVVLVLEVARAGVSPVGQSPLGTRRHWLWVLPPLVWVWVQMHGGAMLVFFLLGCYVVGGVLQARLGPGAEFGVVARSRSEWWQMGWVTALAVAVLWLNPYGWQLPLHLWHQMRPSLSRAFITEWLPPTAMGGFNLILGLYYIALAGGVLGLALNWRRWDWARALVWVGFAYFSWKSVRFIPYFGLVGVPIGVAAWAQWWEGRVDAKASGKILSRWPAAAALAMAVVTGLVVWVGRRDLLGSAAVPMGLGVDPLANPVAAVEYLRHQPATARLFNSNELGNYLMWTTDRKIFIDPRNLVYGDARALEYVTACTSPHGWERLQARWGFDAVMLQPWHSGTASLLKSLARDQQWKLVYLDPAACFFVRRDLAASWQTGRLTDFSDPAKVADFSEHFEKQCIDLYWSLAPLPAPLAKTAARQRSQAAHLIFAQALHNLGAADAAAQEYRRLLAIAPDDVQAMHGLAGLATDRRDWKDALDWLNQALRLQPNFADAHYLRAYIYAQTNRLPDALAELDIVTRQQPHNFHAHLDEASLAEQTGDLDGAVRALRRAIRDLPVPSPLHYTRLGSLLERKGEIVDAIHAYEKAIELWPTEPGLPPADVEKIRVHVEQLRNR